MVSFSSKDLREGELAEILNNEEQRIALARIERVTVTDKTKKKKNILAATVISGEENCGKLTGLRLRPLTNGSSFLSASSSSSQNTLAQLSPTFLVAQTSLPGLALNKFLSPGYSQRGYAINATGLFPRDPIPIGALKLNATSEVKWSSLSTSPSLDLVRDGKVQGSQNIATQNLNIRTGARIHYLDSRLWSGAGAILFKSLKTTSTLAAAPGEANSDKLFQVVRDISGRGFGLYAEQGVNISNAATLSFGGGIGLGTKLETPIIEDGDATNTSTTAKVESLPFFAGAKLQIPFFRWIFADVQLDYERFSLSIPLVNDSTSKAQMDVISFSAGVGVRF